MVLVPVQVLQKTCFKFLVLVLVPDFTALKRVIILYQITSAIYDGQ